MMQGDIGNTGHAGDVETNERRCFLFRKRMSAANNKTTAGHMHFGSGRASLSQMQACCFPCAQHARQNVGWDAVFSHVHHGLHKCNLRVGRLVQSTRDVIDSLTLFSKVSASTRYLQTQKIKRTQSVVHDACAGNRRS